MTQTMLVFSVGPVQGFIASARKTEDLWAGSYILSYLTSVAIAALQEEAGKQGVAVEIVFPAEVQGRRKRKKDRAVASFPNRFMAMVKASAGSAAEIAERARVTVYNELAVMAERAVDMVFGRLEPEKVTRLKVIAREQVRSLFEVFWSLEPYDESDYSGARLRLERRLAASKNERPLYYIEQTGLVCSVCAEKEALNDGFTGKENYGQMKMALSRLWGQRSSSFGPVLSTKGELENEGRIKDNEYLCGVCLLKRTARDYFRELFGAKGGFGAYPSTRDIAGGEGRYYAVLMMDGDDMGKWLSGERKPAWAAGLDDISYHQELSRRMNVFAEDTVAQLVSQYKGHLVYSGGDDVLAFFPVAEALPFAQALRDSFSDEAKGLGREFTASTGLVIAHEKEPLHLVINKTREMEKRAKGYWYCGQASKDALGLCVMSHNGEMREVILPWQWPQGVGAGSESPVSLVKELLLSAYQNLSFTFANRFRDAFLPLLPANKLSTSKLKVFDDPDRRELEEELFRVEIARLLRRSAEPTDEDMAFDARKWAEHLQAIHAILPSTLQFVHLLEMTRFFKRKGVLNGARP